MFPNKYAIGLLSTIVLASCSSLPEKPVSKLKPVNSKPLCASTMLEIHADYPTARANECEIIDNDLLVLTIRPEADTDPQGKTINNSPWYGFRVDPLREGEAYITLKYEHGTHRYPPKLSFDGKNWEWLDSSKYTLRKDDVFEMRLPLNRGAYFVSAQEIFTPEAHNSWSKDIARREYAKLSVIGQSKEGRDISMIEIQTDPNKKKPYVIIVGRQHPPEVTGALALMPFVERLLKEDVLANNFLNSYNIIIIPMVNPDGIINGNWRFNMGGMDLNRDWRDFSQPETKAVRNVFSRLDNEGQTVAFFMDFHSTSRNLVYTQDDSETTAPQGFDREWLSRSRARLDAESYAFTREPRKVSERPISKTFVFERYGVPAVTFEIGDNTSRDAIKEAMPVFAEEMMLLLLEGEN